LGFQNICIFWCFQEYLYTTEWTRSKKAPWVRHIDLGPNTCHFINLCGHAWVGDSESVQKHNHSWRGLGSCLYPWGPLNKLCVVCLGFDCVGVIWDQCGIFHCVACSTWKVLVFWSSSAFGFCF
jgi:hypothetical protein